MYKTLIILSWLLNAIYSRPIQPVCSSTSFTGYLLTSFINYQKSRDIVKQYGLSECIREFQTLGLNENYCKCDSVNVIQSSSLPSSTTEKVKGTITAAKEEDEISGSGNDGSEKACSIGFKMTLRGTVLGGDIVLYKRPFTGVTPSKLIVTVLSEAHEIINQKEVLTNEEKGWLTLPINEFSQKLQEGKVEANFEISVKTESGDVLSCEEAQKFFIFTCSSPVLPKETSSYSNLQPVLLLYTQKSYTWRSQITKTQKKRDSDKERCHFASKKVRLSQIVTLEEGEVLLESQQSEIDVGSCKMPSIPNGSCSPTEYKDLVYLTRDVDLNAVHIKSLPSAITSQC